MAVLLNKRAFEHAKQLLASGKYVFDQKDDWSEHEPSHEIENIFIDTYGYGEYSKWYLGIDDEKEEDTKGRYKFPYGDFKNLHRCGVLAAENRAGQYNYQDILEACAHLHGMIDGVKQKGASYGR